MTTSILHVIPSVAPRYGGPSAAVLGMCRALGTAGTSALIATTDADGPARLPVALGEVQNYIGVPTILFGRKFGEAFKWSGGLARWLNAHVAEFDVVHVHAVFSHSSIAAGRACRQARVPYLVRPLGTLDPWSLSRKRGRKDLLLRFGARDLLSGAAALHYTTAEERRLAEAAVPNLPRGVVVAIGVDEEFFGEDVRRDNDAPTVLSLSRLDRKKGLDLLIHAFHEVARDAMAGQWRLTIAGDGDPEVVAELKALASAGPARERIKFVGWVSGAEKRALLRTAGLFVLPSSQENFGIAVVEALASGVPAVVTPGVNLAGDISSAEAGWVVEGRSEAIAATLLAAISDAGERARRGENGRRLAAVFRWPVIAERLSAVYDDVRGSVVRPVRTPGKPGVVGNPVS